MLKWFVRIGGGLVGLAVIAFTVAYVRSDNDCDKPAAIDGPRMKAVIHCDYGPPDVLKVGDVAKPVPGDDQVLVKVRAAAVNPAEWHLVRGKPYIIRAIMGLRRPGQTLIGADYAGTVEAVGRNVTNFKAGDEVFGGRSGAFSQYLVQRAEGTIVPKPATISMEQAAGVATAGITALQALRDKGEVKAGQSVLINGASGGVGTYAVQIAKAMGARVTGVSSTRNIELVRGLGADEMIDYTQSNFTQGDARYDVILDNVGNHGLLDLRRVLKPGGRVVMIGGGGPDDDPWLEFFIEIAKGLILSAAFEERFMFFVAEFKRVDFEFLAGLMAEGKLTTEIDRTYPLAETTEALKYLETGRARGKVILAVE
jgi:NADPH:quinone reductase-like Zn-dependent oxidoreductase